MTYVITSLLILSIPQIITPLHMLIGCNVQEEEYPMQWVDDDEPPVQAEPKDHDECSESDDITESDIFYSQSSSTINNYDGSSTESIGPSDEQDSDEQSIEL